MWENIGAIAIGLLFTLIAWSMPIVGIIIGLIYIAKDQRGLGISIIVNAILSYTFGYNAIMKLFL